MYADVDADVVVDCSGCLLDADADVGDGVEAGVTSLLIGFDIVASQRCTSSVGQANRLQQLPHWQQPIHPAPQWLLAHPMLHLVASHGTRQLQQTSRYYVIVITDKVNIVFF